MLTEEQKLRLANLFKEKIFPAIEENEEAFNEMYKRARKFLDELEEKESE